jgi:hypothetical protein
MANTTPVNLNTSEISRDAAIWLLSVIPAGTVPPPCAAELWQSLQAIASVPLPCGLPTPSNTPAKGGLANHRLGKPALFYCSHCCTKFQ